VSSEQPGTLVGAGGSKASGRAVETAAGLAGAFVAELVIAHVLPAVEYRVARLATPLLLTRKVDDPHDDAPLQEARRVAWERSVAAKLSLLSGDPAPTIVALADELDVKLVVLRARRPLGGWFLGRVRRFAETHTAPPGA
jgi:nucleotide-binding universal stress UspA family protein